MRHPQRHHSVPALASVLLLAVALLCLPGPAVASRGLAVVGQGGQKVGSFSGSYALLVGVSDYRAGWPKLESVPGELATVRRELEADGFTVKTVMDPDGKALERAYADFIDTYGYNKDNRLLFYFSGHGHTLDNGSKGYLVPVDAPDPRQDETNFRRKSLDMTQILAWSRQMVARHALFLFDSCFSGTIFKTKALPDVPPHVTAMTAEPVRQYLTAGSAGEVVPARSVFTPAFIDALHYGLADLDKDGYISGTELGYYLKTKVPRHARQTPQYGTIQDYDLSRGDFVFQVASAAPAPAVTPGSDLEAQRRQVEEERKRLEAEKTSLARDQATLAEQQKLEAEQARLVAERQKLEEERRRLEEQRKSKPPVELAMAGRTSPPSGNKEWRDPATGMEFVWVPGGCYRMGSNDGHGDEKPVHEVCVDGFWMGRYEVTQGQWRKVMGNNPSRFKNGDDYPVEQVSWNDTQKFIAKLNAKGHGRFRLPTEAEWEFAARGGGKDETYSGSDDVDRVAWYNSNSGGKTHPVGGKAPNGLGLYDMSGNVWEWVQDWYDKDAYSGHSRNNPLCNNSASGLRVLRGGSCVNCARLVRCAIRDRYSPDVADNFVGFRLVRLPQE